MFPTDIFTLLSTGRQYNITRSSSLFILLKDGLPCKQVQNHLLQSCSSLKSCQWQQLLLKDQDMGDLNHLHFLHCFDLLLYAFDPLTK